MKNTLTFDSKTYHLQNLISDIDTGDIALPDLQRPYVWNTTKARDFIDSLYHGLPTGLIILWDIYDPENFKKINIDAKNIPKYLVIDGQQRLTTLFSIIRNKEIVSKNVKKFKIKIAFNPIEEIFEVSNPAIEKDIKWIPNISMIFRSNAAFEWTKKYLEYLKQHGIEFDENLIANRISRVNNILNYPLPVLDLSSNLDPELVSEIFVRINSKGEKLKQSDFILTLLSVYWPEGREEIENFCKQSHKFPSDGKPTPYTLIGIKPMPSDIIRTTTAYAFYRGRLKYAYLALKGRDFENKITTPELRDKNLKKFAESVNKSLDLTNWHNFIKIIHSAGFVNTSLISSQVAFYVTYAFYLLGKDEKIPDYKKLGKYIKKWFLFSQLTYRYTGSPESRIEDDLNKIKQNGLMDFIEHTINIELTEDFWGVTLPERLVSSSARNAAYSVYVASLVRSDMNVLFSDIKLKDYLMPIMKGKKKIIDVHHIFPKNYLKKTFGLQKKDYNQVANFIYIEYLDDIKISDQPPKEYWHKLTREYSESEMREIYKTYDLPENFDNMDYFDFLNERRKLIARKIKNYFENL